jgi:hypothetical protein
LTEWFEEDFLPSSTPPMKPEGRTGGKSSLDLSTTMWYVKNKNDFSETRESCSGEPKEVETGRKE